MGKESFKGYWLASFLLLFPLSLQPLPLRERAGAERFSGFISPRLQGAYCFQDFVRMTFNFHFTPLLTQDAVFVDQERAALDS